MPPIVCCIDGNIGAGKTVVLDELERRGYAVFREDISGWGWCLNAYYADQKRWATTLQVAILSSMAVQKRKISSITAPVVFIERSPVSGMVFTRVNFKRGFITADELKLIESLQQHIGWRPDVTMMLTTPVDICVDRISKRNRDCEKEVDASYLIDLAHEYALAPGVTYLDHTGLRAEIADKVISGLQLTA
jgi:deoxyadenosine/deoxycytidine kinase